MKTRMATIWICFLLRGVFYASFIPLWEGYDEWSHFAVLQFLSSQGRLPTTADRQSNEIQESLSVAPLAWTLRDSVPGAVTHDQYWTLEPGQRSLREARLAELRGQWANRASPDNIAIYEAQQPPLYYWILYPFYKVFTSRPLTDRVFALRIVSLFLASFVIPIAYASARLVFGGKDPGLQVAVTIAVMPELLIDVGRVGNESLAITLFSLLVYCALRLLRDPADRKIALAAGVSLGLGLITKAYFLSALPVIITLAVWKTDTAPPGRRRIFQNGLAMLLPAILISGWWYWRNLATTNSWSGQMFDASLGGTTAAKMLGKALDVQWGRALDSLFFTHIWFGGWSFLQVRSWMYRGFECVALLSVTGIAVLAYRLLRHKPTMLANGSDLGALLLFYLSFVLGLGYHVLITYLAKGESSSAGWYLYCAVLPESLLAALGLRTVFGVRARRWVLPVMAGGFALLDVYTTNFILIPYYTGLIAHKPAGALAALHLGTYRELGIGNVLRRLSINKAAILGPETLGVLWLLATAATAGLLVMCIIRARDPER